MRPPTPLIAKMLAHPLQHVLFILLHGVDLVVKDG